MFCRTQRQHFQSGHMRLKYENQDYALASGSPVLASFSGFAHISVFSEWLLHPIEFDRSDRPSPCSPRLPGALFLRMFILLLFLCCRLWVGVGCP